ncbi:uncharacterized protein LOC110102382 [Dendrobium catenatum]|uniref:uncharacterized protein LOC110102382 n=1 Tax=Dendrobium catenatum TaxID=906689 RepID=UPI0009F4E400|nr:uncharacterized protein LOC110102382 [Dendrobium catenatum]
MASFFKAFWDIIGEQVNLACLEFFSIGQMEPMWKETVVVLVNRIKGILPTGISEEQAALVHGMSISDHYLLGQEIMNKFKVCKSSKGWMAMKADMEQAYDKMSWRTLELVLLKMGFPQRFQLLVLSYVLAPRFTILVNGATIPNVRKFLTILEDYCRWTGQRINKNKLAILFSRLVPSSCKHRLARLAGCRKVDEMEYLGLKLVMRRLTKADFGPLLQRLHRHTLAWGMQHLLLAGRITLINSVLLPLSVFAVTHTLVPRGVLAKVERICSRFLWDRDSKHKSLHYAAWGSLTRLRHLGGLGFHASRN